MLDELVTEGARRMLVTALEAEVADYIDRHQHLVDAESGHRLVVRNGKAAERTLVTGAGGLKIRAPRVHDKRDGYGFSSSVLPRYARRSPKVAEVLPVLYLRGLSTGDFAPALEEFFGTDAGLSASTVTRLIETWSTEYQAFEDRDLSESDFVYVWADGVVRHEALFDRVGWKDPPVACRGSSLKLGGQPDPGSAGCGGNNPDNAGTGWDCQTVRVRQARRKGVTRCEPVVEPS